MTGKIKEFEEGIATLLSIITDCNNKLKKIALNENPMNTAEYIELMIEGEKRERKTGYLARIRVLEECRQKALIGQEAKGFLLKAKQTRRSASSQHSDHVETRHDSRSSIISRMHTLMNSV
jgi:hypothetical protein